MRVEPVRLAADVDVDAAVLRGVDVVEAEGGLHPDPPVDRAERGVAAEQIEGRPDDGDREGRSATAEERLAQRPRRPDRARRRQVAPFEQRVADAREREERALADDRRVPLEDVRVVRVVPMVGDVGVVAAAVVPIPVRHRQVPAIRHREEHLLARRRRLGFRLAASRRQPSVRRRRLGRRRLDRLGRPRTPETELEREELRRADAHVAPRHRLEALTRQRQRVGAGRQIEEAEDAVGGRVRRRRRAGRLPAVRQPLQHDVHPGNAMAHVVEDSPEWTPAAAGAGMRRPRRVMRSRRDRHRDGDRRTSGLSKCSCGISVLHPTMLSLWSLLTPRPLRRQRRHSSIRLATRPVQPVWWLAPSPAPLSP